MDTQIVPVEGSQEQMLPNPTEEKLKNKALLYIKQIKSSMEQLQLDRAVIMKSYNRDLYGNETKGHSKVVMSDVADTIEWIMPSLMRIFYGGQDVVSLIPQGQEDEQKATLMEEKINYDFQKGMNGFQILYDFFKDALMFKMGVVKYRWVDDIRKEKQRFEGLNQMEFMTLQMDPEYEIINSEIVSQSIAEDGITTVSIYNVDVYHIVRISKPLFENIAPEEFGFLPYERSVSDTRCVYHKKKVKTEELKKYGISKDDVVSEIEAFGSDPLYIERFEDLGGLAFLTPDENQDEVWLYECYLNDYDDNGNKLPKIVTITGNKVVKVEDNTYGKPPFCVCSPIRTPHRLIGSSIAELVVDIQKLHTTLVRYILDNVYFQNNGVQVVNPLRINMDDLLNNNFPGGKVRTLLDTNPNDAIYPVPTSPLPPHVMELLEYKDVIKENRTGITKYNQGLDSKSLNRTASGISQIMNAAQQRVELIARIFAESEDGVKGMFQALVDMNLKFFSRSINIKLNNQWTTISPMSISGMYDLIIDIGAGTGSKEIKVNQLMMMLDKSMAVAGLAPMIIMPDNIYSIMTAIWENLGYKNTQQFVTDPKTAQPVGMPGGMNGAGQMGGTGQIGGGGQPGLPVGGGAGVLQ